jgi:NTP pyrophosphatase (non-canonical NTP hydrolase)
MESLEKEIIDWRKEIFPNVTIEGTRKKLLEECCELIAAIVSKNEADILRELADVFIAGSSHAEKTGRGTVRSEVVFKMKVNRNRTYGDEDENGDRPRVKTS